MPWTQFWDMHSGGGTKEPPYEKIYIEAAQKEAEIIFYNRFGHNPNRVTCTCCGEDYSVTEYPNLEQASGYHRGCDYDSTTRQYVERIDTRYGIRRYVTVEEYVKEPNVLVIPASEIKPDERIGDLPCQGYVWVD